MLSALALLLMAAAPLQDPAGSVRGVVRSEASGEPIPSAVVEVLAPGEPRIVATDAAGGYRVAGVEPGRRLVRARHLGHAPLEVEVLVPAGREVVVDLSLPLQPVALAPVEVRAGDPTPAGDTLAARRADLGLAGTRALESTPGLAELGLTDVARGAPGQDPVDPSDVLFVRGAAADLKLVYLDGAPVYAPFPLGGILDPFTPGLLASADVYLGGAPARYDGGLSYILDLRTRGARPDGVHSSGALDLLSARALAETTLPGGAGLLASARGVHRAAALDLLDGSLPYGYREGLVRLDVPVGGAGAVSVTGFLNREEVSLGSTVHADSAIAWGNSAVSMRYRGILGGTRVEIGGALGEFTAGLPLTGTEGLTADGTMRRARLSADLTRRVGDVQLRYGASYDHQEQSYRVAASPRDGFASAGAAASAGEGAAVAGAYAEVAWQALPRLGLRGGVRADHADAGGETVLGPRLAATWLVTESAALTVAAGRYHQYLRAPTAMFVPGAVRDTVHITMPLALGSASHFAVGLDQDLGEGMRLGVEGYFKSFSEVPTEDASEANASGVDLWVRRDGGAWTGWLGYSLAWVWSLREESDANRFAGRHLLSAGLGAPLGESGRLDVRFAYGAGLPYSAIPLTQSGATPVRTADDNVPPALATETSQLQNGVSDSAPLLPAPEDPYVRMDVSLSRTWTPRWAGADTELRPYLRLLNTLGRRDALFYHYDLEGDGGTRALGALPLVPVVGMEWKF